MALRLLCITAHPDDECFAFGGALALAAQRGVETSLICITDGSAGSYHGAATTTTELGQLRRAELAASCKLLGIRKYEVLDYQDGQLEFASFSNLAGDLVQRIRILRPHIILTFSGDGGLNTHADHTVTSSVATAAFHWAGSPKRFPTLGELHTPQRLYYLTTDFFVDGRHRHIPAPWTHTLDVASVLPLRLKAMKAHTTQAPLMERAGPLIFAKHGDTEHYSLAASPIPQPATQSTDLFEGVVE
ncbi:MAG TPA: PIG-L family deacetylase [Acidobacteriaceae bacterium]|nr:PIG-L family deacetylase [Acidobacteriaceae bacterium]